VIPRRRHRNRNPACGVKEIPGADLRRTRHRQARAANLPTPLMPGMAYGTCSAMPAFAQALTLALREMLQKGGQVGVQRYEISSK
jgi:hypothetical protein